MRASGEIPAPTPPRDALRRSWARRGATAPGTATHGTDADHDQGRHLSLARAEGVERGPPIHAVVRWDGRNRSSDLRISLAARSALSSALNLPSQHSDFSSLHYFRSPAPRSSCPTARLSAILRSRSLRRERKEA